MRCLVGLCIHNRSEHLDWLKGVTATDEVAHHVRGTCFGLAMVVRKLVEVLELDV